MRRWTYRDKVLLIEGVRNGAMDRELVLKAWDIGSEEFSEWERFYDAHGADALKTTKIQKYRGTSRKPRRRRAGEVAPRRP